MTMIKSSEQVEEEKETTEQAVNYPLGIRRCNRVRNGFIALCVAGCISYVYGSVLSPRDEVPEIYKTHQTAQTSLRTLKRTRKNLTKKLVDLPYKTTEIEKFEMVFNKPLLEKIIEADSATVSLKKEISKIEKSGSEFEQYSQNRKTKKRKTDIFTYSGLYTIAFSLVGCILSNSKKMGLKIRSDLERKRELETLKNENN